MKRGVLSVRRRKNKKTQIDEFFCILFYSIQICIGERTYEEEE
jgi:hypothetical protein